MSENHPEAARPGGRILIVDDEESVLQSIAVLLRRQGYECRCASDAPEAAGLLDSEPFDLLISDIRMPGNQDLDLIQTLPRAHPGLPVILMTGYPTMPTAVQALQLPVIAYLMKPIEFDELLAHVQRGISFRRVSATLDSASGRLEGWVRDMKHLKASFDKSPQAMAQGTLEGALALALGNLGETLLDLKAIFQAGAGLAEGKMDCTLVACPKVQAYEKAIRDSIEVLEATKSSFRSKEVGALRKRLETLVPGTSHQF